MIGVIARREAGAMFRSPLAWVLLASLQAVVAFVFLLHLDSYMQVQAQLAQRPDAPGLIGYLVPRMFSVAGLFVLLAIPLLTMNLVAGERRQGTLALLMSAPVSTLEIILGKFLGVCLVMGLLVLLFTLMPASLGLVTRIDIAALLLAALGLVLFLTTAAAAGLYLSTLTQQPALAAVATLGLLLVLLLAGEWGATLAQPWSSIVTWPAPTTHLQPFIQGLFDTGALAHFLLLTAAFLALATRRLDNDRLQY